MKKRLLLSVVTVMTVLTSFALEVGEYVYTPQGRFKITNNANAFTGSISSTFDGFQVVTAGENTVADIFTTAEDGTVGTYFQTLATAENTEGMSYKLALDGEQTYVVSFLIKSSSIMSTHDAACSHYGTTGTNKVMLYSTAKDAGASGEVVETYSAESTIGTEWTRMSFNISNVDASKDYYLSFAGMNQDVCVADIQINEAAQVADMRKVEYAKSLAEAYLSLKNWGDDVEESTGLNENYDNLQTITDETSLDVVDEYIDNMYASIKALNEEKFVDNWLGEDFHDTWGTYDMKQQKVQDWGMWTFFVGGGAAGRLHLEGVYVTDDAGNVIKPEQLVTPAYLEGPHYAGSLRWKNAGIETTKYQEFPKGSYVFTIDLNGTCRQKPTSACWDNDWGLQLFKAQIYVVSESGDTIAKTEPYLLPTGTNLPESNYASNFLKWDIPEEGNYKVGVIARTINDIEAAGGTITFKDATLYYYTESKYTKKQKDFIADVLEQIKAGRSNITAATEGINNSEKYWGKVDLQACIDTMEAKVAAYEAMDTAAIMEYYSPDYVKSTTNAEEGLLVYEIYQETVKDLLAANRRFNAVNDTVASIDVAIADAKKLLKNRVFDVSTEREQLQTEITNAENLSAQMKSTDYSVENAQSIKDEIAALAQSSETFKNGVPAEAITTLLDIDFSKRAVLEEGFDYETTGGNVTVNGETGSITITNFRTSTPSTDTKNSAADNPFELGFTSNGENVQTDVLRVGNGVASASFDVDDFGTDIVKVSADWWFGRLQKCYVGMYLMDEEDENVSGFYFTPYDDNTFNYNPFNISTWLRDKVGFAANTAGDTGFLTDGNKTSMEIYLDYGTKKMQMITTIAAGTYTSDWVPFNGNVITSLSIQSNYNYAHARRCWMDNLKVVRIAAGPVVSVFGDVNGDNQITMADANAVVNYFLASDTEKAQMVENGFNVEAANVNGDEGISMADANAIVNMFLGVVNE